MIIQWKVKQNIENKTNEYTLGHPDTNLMYVYFQHLTFVSSNVLCYDNKNAITEDKMKQKKNH